MKAIKTIIEAGIKANHSRTQIEGALLVEGYKKAEAAKAISEAGLARSKSGFRSDLYRALESGPLDAKAFADMLKGESKNVQNHESHFNEIRLLVNKVWDNAS